MIVWQSFHDSARKDAVFIGTATAAVTLPASFGIGSTSYAASKLGLIKFLEILAAEEKDISIRFLHPGVIETDMVDKSGVKDKLPLDKGQSFYTSIENTKLMANSRASEPLHSVASLTRRSFPCWSYGVVQS